MGRTNTTTTAAGAAAEMTVAGIGVDGERVRRAVERLVGGERPRYRRLWAYFRNPMRVCGVSGTAGEVSANADRPYRQAQEWGLPARITGVRSGGEPFDVTGDAGGAARKEVVIENDIGWRIDTMADYLFGKPLVIASAAADPARRETIGRLLRMILAGSGGIQFLQQLAVTGSVHGFVDVLVKLVGSGQSAGGSEAGGKAQMGCGASALGEAPAAGGRGDQSPPDADHASGARAAGVGPARPAEPVAPGGAAAPAASGDGDRAGRDSGAGIGDDALLERVARMIRLEIVEPARALPLLSCEDYRVIEAYGQVWERESAVGSGQSAVGNKWWGRLRSMLTAPDAGRVAAGGEDVQVVELITADAWVRVEDGRVVARGRNSLGEVPVAHIQNAAAAMAYAGPSDVEPLIPLQDELNTRLSDRAHRITMQSFRMYLAKGIDAFNDQPVTPGRMWQTDNEQASVQEFGGDASCPSEEAHIADLREAMDKASGVSPIAAGAIKNRIGRLTSAAALRITLLALLSKTDKKRTVYGAGIERVCELALKWLDVAGLFRTTPAERRVEIHWPSPLPENEVEKLEEAEAKLRVGVDRGVVLRELGY